MYIRITMAMTSDGKTADLNGEWYPLCPYERRRFHEALAWADAVVIGERSVRNSNISFLPPQNMQGNPLRVVLDRDFSLTPKYRVFDTARSQTVLLVRCDKMEKIKEKLISFKNKGVGVRCLSGEGPFRATDILEVLKEYGSEKILVVGGGRTNSTFIKEGVFDEYQVTVTPYLLGGSPYTPVGGEGFIFPGQKLDLYKVEICPCGEEVVLYYRKQR